MKYYELQIASLDEDYLNDLTAIIRAVFIEIVLKNIEDENDSKKPIDSIYTNCLDSRFDIDEDELETQQAKDFINNF